MNKAKRFISLILVSMMLCSMVACSASYNANTDIVDKQDENDSAITETIYWKVNIFNKTLNISDSHMKWGMFRGSFAGDKVFDYVNDVPWYEHRKSIKNINFESDIIPISTKYWFYDFANVGTIDLTHLKTSQVTDMSGMFSNCSGLTSLDVRNFDTSKVADMYAMFNNCKSLTALDVSGFNTGNVTDMSWMFNGCDKITLDCSEWNVDKVTNYADFNTDSPNVVSPNWKK